MMKRLIVLLTLLLTTLLSLSAVTAYLDSSYAFTLDTNIFSNPLPSNIGNDKDKDNNDLGYSSYLIYRRDTAPFLFRLNNSINTQFSLFFSDKGKTGLSFALFYGFPFKAYEVKPSSTDASSDWSYVKEDALAKQEHSLFFGFGPIFRSQFGPIDLGLSLRVSIGTYNAFKEDIIIGVVAQPYLNYHFTPFTYLTVGALYDAHLMKFLPSSSTNYYEERYFMLTLAPYIGLGLKIGDRG